MCEFTALIFHMVAADQWQGFCVQQNSHGSCKGSEDDVRFRHFMKGFCLDYPGPVYLSVHNE